MKLQYLGFLPLLIIVIALHWKLLKVYLKYGTIDYLDSRIPSDCDWVISLNVMVTVFWSLVVVVGFIWALS